MDEGSTRHDWSELWALQPGEHKTVLGVTIIKINSSFVQNARDNHGRTHRCRSVVVEGKSGVRVERLT